MNTRLLDIPPVVKNIIIINVLFFLAKYGLGSAFHINLDHVLGLFFVKSTQFQPYQLVTHMFMHGGLMHIFFNMIMLWMFGRIIESVWGPKRFFIFYFVTGLGAAFFQIVVTYIRFTIVANQLPEETINIVINEGYQIMKNGQYYTDGLLNKLNLITNSVTIGASGAVFGVVLAFGMLFPNTQLMLLFPPIPIKAKYAAVLMLGLGIMLDFRGNVAHFAHLGGMVFGYILIKYWKKDRKNFY